jgi:hypothetical protein
MDPDSAGGQVMKTRLILVLMCLVLTSGAAAGQGLLLPNDSRIAPLPRPLGGPHPLRVQSLKVETRIQGQVAITRVAQVFANDLGFTVDGTYFYPLPEDATFVEFATWDGERRLRGEVLEREEARNRYLAIVRRCVDPGLLEYAGANLFQARVFPVPARGEKRVELSYSQVLKADHGLVSYVFPLQSGTQANPQTVGSASVKVELVSDRGVGTLYSPTHRLDIQRDGERHARVSFEVKDTVPDRNFHLYYAESPTQFGLSAVTYREAGEDGYFVLLVSAPAEGNVSPAAKDIIFVLDTSGSMQERGKLEKALAALRFAVRSLNSGDRFNILTFSTDVRRFRDGLVPASTEYRDAALTFIDRQAASGGTNIREALGTALSAFQPGERPRYVVFVTDGLPTVGETDTGRILRDTSAANGVHARVFTLGLGFDVNTFLLDQISARNSGSADYIAPDEDVEVRLSNFVARIAHPAMTDLKLELPGIEASDLYPRPLPDLFRGSQLTVMGRYSGSGSCPVVLRGMVGGRQRSIEARVEFPASAAANDFLPRLWAMRKVGYLLEQIRVSGENAELKNEVVRLAKKFGFVTPYTSYLAADDRDLMTASPMPALQNLRMAAADQGTYSGNQPMRAREAVAASVALKDMKGAEVAPSSRGATVRRVGTKTFRLKDGTWVDDAFDSAKQLPSVELVIGSEALLAAAVADRDLGRYAALGRNVVVVHRGKVYRIRA